MLIEYVIAVALLCGLWYLVTTFIPMPAAVRTILTIVLVVVVVVLTLQLFGLTNLDLRLRK